MTPSGGYLLMRRAGMVWGLRNGEVRSLTRRDGAYRIATSECLLVADEILGVVDRLRVTPVAAALRRFWAVAMESVEGMAVHGDLPLLVVDPRRPPVELRMKEDVVEGEGDGKIRE